MTDTVVNPEGGVQNPATSGSFPLLLQYARDRKLLSLEDTVHKMTGASAERFNLRDRGILREGLSADITIFDWNTVKDNNTVTETGEHPTGIEAVFINGRLVKENEQVDETVNAGMALPIY